MASVRPRSDSRTREVLVRALVLPACALLATVLLVLPSIVEGFPIDCVDNDGDGYGAFGDPFCPNGPVVDCDDTNGNVYPGAPEICDGFNNDCYHPNWPSLTYWAERVISLSADAAVSVFAADVDGDDDPDVLSASLYDDKIAWYENTAGDGTIWVEHVVTTAADDATSVFAVDVDGDTDVDVLSASDGDDTIAWYENQAGDGSIWIRHVISTSAIEARSVFAADVDGDTDMDVLSASRGDNRIVWYENLAGDGSVWMARDISTSASGASAVFAVDVDGDNDVDVLSASRDDDTIAWFENSIGDGSLWIEQSISTSADGVWSVFAADMDGDNDTDVLAASVLDDKIAWFENTAGDGSTWSERVVSTSADGARSVFAADVDGDTDMDVLSASSEDDKIAWYDNTTGDGSTWTERAISSSIDDAWSVFAVDLDGDNDLNVLFASLSGDEIAWFDPDHLEQDGDGDGLAECNGDCNDGNPNCISDCETDFDGDGIPFCADTCVDGDQDGHGASGGSGFSCEGPDCNDEDVNNWISCLECVDSDGDEYWFGCDAYITHDGPDCDDDDPNNWLSCASCVDLDGDGFWVGCDAYETIDGPDCNDSDPDNWISCATCVDSDEDTYFAGCDAYGAIDGPDCDDTNGDVYPGAPELCDGVNNDCDHPSWPSTVIWEEHQIPVFADDARDVIAADLDGDHDMDALSASSNDDTIRWYENTAGDASEWTVHVIYSAADFAYSVVAADVDGDDDLDVVAASVDDDTVWWFENAAGDGSVWTSHIIASSANGPTSVFVADIDGDLDLDVLSASVNDDQIAWYENTAGDGTAWTGRIISTLANGALSVFAADIDGDNDMDVLSASLYDDEVSWYENTAGNGLAWTKHFISTSADGASDVFAADIDGDDDLDVLSASQNDSTIAWYENTAGDGLSWTEREISTTAQGAVSAFAADVDGDDDLDVLSASLADNTIAWYENTAGDGSDWNEYAISTSAMHASSVFAADMNGDSYLDALSASADDGKIAWYASLRFDADQDGDGLAICEGDCLDTNPNCTTDCTDLDGDGFCVTHDCDDTRPYCTDDCTDLDGDDYCAPADCDEGNPYCHDNCTDADGDGYCVTTDCDDTNENCTSDCTDADDDGYCVTTDCNDSSPFCTTDCTDADNDGYCGETDCDDTNENCTSDCTDTDGDGYCVTIDCDDDEPLCSIDCTDPDDDGYCGDADCDNDNPDCRGNCTDADADQHCIDFDCDDVDPNNWISCLQCADLDEDTFFAHCDAYITIAGPDCDDSEATVYPGAPELCDGLNNDCDHPTWPHSVSWSPETVSATADGARSVFAGDIDGDGDVDVLSASDNDDKVAWYENTAANASDWVEHVISTADRGASAVFSADLDGDDDPDVIMAAHDDDRIVWHENNSGDGLSWARRVISWDAHRPVSVFVADVDGDNDLDVLSASRFDDKIAWYENLFGDASVWAEHQVSTDVGDARSVFAADLDGDGDMDVLSVSYIYARVSWHENTAGNGSAWTEHEISTSAHGATSVFAADVDGDDDMDVLSASGLDSKVAWYDNSSGDGAVWVEHEIPTSGIGAASVFALDMDGDDDVDVLSTHVDNGTIALHVNVSGDGATWAEQLLSTSSGFPVSVFPADVDGDNDLDVLSASSNDDLIELYRREGVEHDDDGDGLRECDGDCDDTTPYCISDCTDLDDDGFCAGFDCDDSTSDCTDDCSDGDEDGLRLCDGDCDDLNSACTTDCTDNDGDGFCVTHDCDDVNAYCTTDCTDDDGDNFCVTHDCNDAIARCNLDCGDGDGDGVDCVDDCDDTDPQTFPGAREICTDAMDNDCDGQTDQEDSYCSGLIAHGLRFGPESNETLVWDAIQEAESYAVYRGTIGPDGFRGYTHLCEAAQLDSPSAEDPDVPPRHEGFYYLVAGQRTDGDLFVTGPMGQSSAGVSRPDSDSITCGPRVYVDPDVAVGTNDGLSWATAYTGVVVAMLHEPFRDRGIEVWIRGAVEENAAVIVSNRAGAELLGGFAGTENASWERSPETTPTTWDPTNPDNPLLTVTGASVLLDAVTLRNGSTGLAGGLTSRLVEFREVQVDQMSGYGIDMIFDGPEASRLNVQNSVFTDVGGAIRASARGGELSGLIRRNTVEGASDAAMRFEARPYAERAEARLDAVANVISQSQTGFVLTAENPDRLYDAVQASFLGSNLVYGTSGPAVIVEALGEFSVASGPAGALSIPTIVGNTLSDGGGSGVMVTASRTDFTGNESQHPVRSEPQIWDNLITFHAGPGIEEGADNTETVLVSDPVVVGNDLFGNSVYYRDEGALDLDTIGAVNALAGAYDNYDAEPAYTDREAGDYHLRRGTVLGIGSGMRYLANSSDPGLGMSWVEPAFDDSGWSDGAYGVGYDTGPPPNAGSLLRTTVPDTSHSVYTRIPFTVNNPGEIISLILGADFDDAYAAWINGVEVFRSPSLPVDPLEWDASAPPHESSNGQIPAYEMVDITALGVPALHDGVNVLAVGVWNESAPSDDLVLVPVLIIDQEYETTDAGHLEAPRIATEDIDGDRRSVDGDRDGTSRPDTGADER